MTERQLDWLLVDDDDVFAATLARRIAQATGERAATAADAAAALRLAREQRPRRVVLDLRLAAGESGLQLLPALRAALPDARIVLLTGFASIVTAVAAMKAGADDYLAKPLAMKDLLAAFTAAPPASDARGAGPASSTAAADDDAAPMTPRRLEWEHIQRVLADAGGNISVAARRLGLHRRSLQRKLAKRPVPR